MGLIPSENEVALKVKPYEEDAARYELCTVTDNMSLVAADEALTEIKKRQKELETERVKITKPMLDAKAAIDKLFKTPFDRLEKARKDITTAMNTYKAEQERSRLEQERKLQEQARAEEERKRKVLEERAQKAEAAGKADKAEALREQAETVAVPVPVLASVVIETKNNSRPVYKFEVVDPALVPNDYKCVDMEKIGAVVKATKGTISIPGIRTYTEQSR